MSYARYLSLLFLLFLLLAVPSPGQTRRRTPPPAPPVTPPKAAPIRGLAEQTQRGELTVTRFSNGLRLICGERHSAELTAIAVRLGFGAADEPPDAPGVAWVVAYGLLSEAERAELAATGATLDTLIDAQATTLTVVAPATQTAGVAGLLLRAVARTGFDEERLRGGVAQATRAWSRCQSRAEDVSRTAWLTLAAGRRRASLSEENFKAVTLDAARAFHTAHLTPRRTVVAVTGDVNLVETLRTVADATGDWKPEAKDAATPAATGDRYQAERGPQGQTWVHIGYALPALRDEERVALEIICAALASGRRARLSEALVENRRLASEAAARVDADAQKTTLCISLSVHPERLDRAEALTIEAVERLRRERLSEGELQRAKAQLELDRLTVGDRVDAWARQLAAAEFGPGVLKWLDDFDRLESLTAEQVRAVAAKHLTATRLVAFEYEAATAPLRTFTPEKFFETVGLLVPQTLVADIAPNETADAPETVVVPTKPRPKAAKDGGLVVLPPAEPVREYATLRGPRVLVRPDPARPLTAIGLYFQGGRFIEDETNAGVTELMLRVMLRSSVKYAPDGLLDEVERLGGRMHIVNERDFFGFELSVVARHAEPALRRLVTLVERPNFDASVASAERERLPAEQKARATNSVELAAWLARRSLFPSHPYGFPPLGVAGTVGKLDETAVQRWYAATIQRQLPIVVIVGGTQGSTLVTRDITEGFVRRETDTSLKARVAQPAAAPLVQESTMGTRDVAAFAFATPGGRDADHRWAVSATCLARRLEAEALHFTVQFAPALQRGELLVMGEGRPDDAPRLVETVERAVRELEKRPPSADEWRAAGRRAATEAVRANDAVQSRSRGYATAVYLGMAPSEVETAAMSIRQTTAPSADFWEEISIGAAGRGVVRGARLARPKTTP